ncbi:MAG: peptide-methionine (S)-S-oxide reductase MsrA [Phototrophicaceae bacterium]
MAQEITTLGGGCFWCIEAIYDQLKGVTDVVSGYSGGRTQNPTYRAVCDGVTGHAEVVQVTFDNEIVSFQDLLDIFFTIHNPTTLNQQGADIGTQYRSAIFFHSDEQKRIAQATIDALNQSNVWGSPIVTEVTRFETFYGAEDYHQEYFANNKDNRYCQVVVAPKVAKFRQYYFNKLKA